MRIASLLAMVFVVSPVFAQCYVVNGRMICNVSGVQGKEIVVPTKKTTAELHKLLKQIENNDMLLRQALKHPSPEYRFTGIYLIAIKKLQKQEELIKMLEDNEPNVRLAARQALVILTIKYGKREDFGPLDGASKEQIIESITEWKKWWSSRKNYLDKTINKSSEFLR